jgi:CelD/BcsL family acetyltransferase involved in cellulose biosynthesis
MPFSYEVVLDETRFRAIEPAWQELWHRSRAGIFQSHNWIAAAQNGSRLNIGLAWEQDRLLAAMPLAIRYRSGLRVLEWAGQQFSDYCDALADSSSDAILRFLWNQLVRAGGFDLVWLKQIAEGANFHPLAKPWRGMKPEVCLRLHNVWSSGESWFRSLNKKTRNDHLRSKRILGQQAALTFREVTNEPLKSILSWATDLKQDWAAKRGLQSVLLQSPNMLAQLVSALDALGVLKIFLLQCGDRPVAISINAVQNDEMLAFFATYDAAYQRGSPGIVLMTEYTMWAFDRGIKAIDYLRGEESYKFKFANVAVPMSHLIAAKTLRGGVGLLGYRWQSRGTAAVERPAIGSAYRTQNGNPRLSPTA